MGAYHRIGPHSVVNSENDMTPDTVNVLLNLQFEAIGEVYDPEFRKKPCWYRLKTWTKDQKSWFDDEAAKQLLKQGYPRHTINSTIAWWCMTYGWKETHAKTHGNIKKPSKETRKNP